MRTPIARVSHTVILIILVCLSLAGCVGIEMQVPPPPAAATSPAREPSAVPAPIDVAATVPPPATPPPATPAAAPTQEPSATPAPTSTPTAEPPLRLGIAPEAPPAAVAPVLQALGEAGFEVEQADGEVDLQLFSAGTEGRVAAWERVFTPAGRLSSLLDSIDLAQLEAAWTGSGRSPSFASIYVAEEDLPLLEPLLGQPGASVKAVPADTLEAAVWSAEDALAIVPFDALTPRLRAIKLEGQSPVDNRFDGPAWPLTARASLLGLTGRGRELLATAAERLPVTNRDPDKLTVLVMTGVTAMARNSAVAIEKSGDDGFLARVVGPELAAADITTISNEIPFVPGCVANDSPNNLVLCSKPEYWDNLALSGVDAVGLSGNHLLDFGRQAALDTLALYEEKKIPVYGGGANEAEAAKPLVIEHNGNRLGFLAANQYGPPVAWAGPDKPGSARFDLPAMQAAVRDLEPQVDVVFAEVQHLETNYRGEYVNVPNDRAEIDFRGLADAGADVVTGIMAHAPQAVERRDGKLILYGLGNLYFDQTWSWPTRTGLVPRHTIYDGKLINTELLVTVIEKNFQLRWATPEERKQVLKSIFDVSRW